jgi:CRISPR-associated protein Csb2
MIAFAFRFPAGRYHATPWGRHANEADVAWPPEPVRILRALIATWWRKADHTRFPKTLLDSLVEALAAEPPVFRLPEAVHAHIRAFMPAPTDRKLIYDAFLRFDDGAELIVAWPGVSLTDEQRGLAVHLLDRMGYLGRAESWVAGRIADDWDGQVNACPRSADSTAPASTVPVDVMAALTPAAWAVLRARFLPELAGMTKSKRAAMAATLPEALSEALAVDTSDWQKTGWSSPPPLRKIVYDRPSIGPLAAPRARSAHRTGQPGTPEVARFVLAGRPQPRIEDALRIGEIARRALMSGSGDVPPEFSGRDAAGPQRDDPAHAHAFFLPEDADGDNLIDHLIVYCRRGFSAEARRRLDRLTALWLAHGRANEEGERGRKEWRLALEDIAAPESFGKVSALLRPSRRWTSVTPYLMPWHAKPDFGVVAQIRREIERRAIPSHLTKEPVLDLTKRAVAFHRTRSRPGLSQPDRLGAFVSLTFAEEVTGPLALGFACHYGLGLFAVPPESSFNAIVPSQRS